MLSIFAVIFVAPLVTDWPNKVSFSMEHVIAVFTDDSLLQIYINTLEMAVLTAIIGTFTAYGAALVTARSHMPKWCKGIIEGIALVTNTIPGMVLGVAFQLSKKPAHTPLSTLYLSLPLHQANRLHMQ